MRRTSRRRPMNTERAHTITLKLIVNSTLDRQLFQGFFGADSNSVASFQPGRLNLNTATKEDLMMLPGIGEAFAERIILYRQDHGAFRRIEDLRKVKGIGGRKFRTIKPYITVK